MNMNKFHFQISISNLINLFSPRGSIEINFILNIETYNVH